MISLASELIRHSYGSTYVHQLDYCSVDGSRKLERVEWVIRCCSKTLMLQIHHPLHPPTFLAQYNKFWISDKAQRSQIVTSGWLALLYIVLCLGLHFSDDGGSQHSGLESQLLSVRMLSTTTELIRA